MDDNNAYSPPRERKMTSCPSAASRVFNVPELLENVYHHLDALDLLNATQVCQCAQQLIEKSRPVRRRMCLEPDDQPPLHLPLRCRNVPGLTVEADVGAVRLQHALLGSPCFGTTSAGNSKTDAFIRAAFAPHQKLPRLGSRARSMYLSQPLVTQGVFIITYCNAAVRSPPMPGQRGCVRTGRDMSFEYSIEAFIPEGVRLSDLLEVTKRFRTESLLCPRPEEVDVGRDGEMPVRVEFKGVVPGVDWLDLYCQPHIAGCFNETTQKYECPGKLGYDAKVVTTAAGCFEQAGERRAKTRPMFDPKLREATSIAQKLKAIASRASGRRTLWSPVKCSLTNPSTTCTFLTINGKYEETAAWKHWLDGAKR